MQEQLNTADLEIEIGDLIEFHKPSGNPFFGVWTTCHFTSGRVGATVHVDERFTGDNVTVTETEEKVHHTIDAFGLDLREALNVLRDRLLASAPSYEIQRGA